MQTRFSFLKKSGLVALTVMAGWLSSCEKTIGEPPLMGDANIVANTTIRDLKARYTKQDTAIAITDSVVISGIVNMDDRTGNYYQQISIQDETGGILLRLAGSNLNTSYPVGRRIFVKCKGLYLGDYGRMIQLGGGVYTDSTRLPLTKDVTLLAPALQDQHIVKGGLNQPLVPRVVTVGQLGTSLQDPFTATLIKVENFEFAPADMSRNYADATASGNRIVQGCTGGTSNRLTLRTSNFASFANLPVAQGNGSVTGIYSLFNSTKQLTIRDTTDVAFNGVRCTGSSGGAIGTTTLSLGNTSPLLLNFDNIGSGLPAGVFVTSNAGASATGTGGTYSGTKALWNSVGAGFKNFASAGATGLGASSTAGEQDNATNRALGVRQTGTADIGGDPGAAFVFVLANTTGKNNLKLDFQLQSLDATSSRTTTWAVDYALGDNPTGFTTTPATGTLTTGNLVFSNNAVSATLPSALNNQPQKVWIRIIARTGTSGGGNRASTGIDDVKFSWN